VKWPTSERVNSEQVEPEQVAALPEAEPVAAPATEFAGDLEADPAAISAPNSAADHTGDPSSYEGSGIPRDWSLAAQAVFAKRPPTTPSMPRQRRKPRRRRPPPSPL
jgi:hypothetical protein